jgi:hypothetical protein
VEYESICSPEYRARTAVEVEKLRAASTVRPSWMLNHRLEYLVWLGLPPAILRQRALVHRARLLALAAPDAVSSFNEAFPLPSADPQQVEHLRTEGLGLLLEIQRLRHVQSEFARLRNRLLAVFVAPGVIFVYLAMRNAAMFDTMPLAELAAIFGLLGGYLSVLLRASALRWSSAYAANYQQVDRLFWNASWNFFLSLLEGSLGAIVLYVAFSRLRTAAGSSIFSCGPPNKHPLAKYSRPSCPFDHCHRAMSSPVGVRSSGSMTADASRTITPHRAPRQQLRERGGFGSSSSSYEHRCMWRTCNATERPFVRRRPPLLGAHGAASPLRAFQQIRQLQALGPRRQVRRVHVRAAHSQYCDDVTPLRVGDEAAVAIPEELAQDGVLGALQDECLRFTDRDATASGELGLVEGRGPDGEEVDLHDDGR